MGPRGAPGPPGVAGVPGVDGIDVSHIYPLAYLNYCYSFIICAWFKEGSSDLVGMGWMWMWIWMGCGWDRWMSVHPPPLPPTHIPGRNNGFK